MVRTSSCAWEIGAHEGSVCAIGHFCLKSFPNGVCVFSPTRIEHGQRR